MTDTESSAIKRLNEAGLGGTEESLPGVNSDLDRQMATGDMQELVSQLDRDAKGWNPDSDPVIFGKVLEITESNEGEFGAYPIIMIETPSGRLINIHCFHTILQNEVQRRMDRGSLTEGSLIAVSYEGRLESKGGREPGYNYKLRVKRPSAS